MRYGLIHIGLSAKLHEGKKGKGEKTDTQVTTMHFSPLKWKIYNTTNCNNSLAVQEQKGSQKSRSFDFCFIQRETLIQISNQKKNAKLCNLKTLSEAKFLLLSQFLANHFHVSVLPCALPQFDWTTANILSCTLNYGRHNEIAVITRC